ncbi:hypothetical protein TVAG_344200 [Trichomonas vaginalis G3]|uniref:Uncharacterized protein n=1 Tax=Trichomonas vaginalis (strain ATCC PRA-98 / G3) TaxID=412133 RepID=A2E7P1_TRIV3|nr:papain family cysteine protease domain containing protein family [Trichomonas vaginalis G3]EAY11326.1 hypothetical protein TVAG_344200 [Trichomonas vaginalis G3]KAI5523769.1 papain family cysteine protease domain containing protein family [Trichomonas vaginalis G3]|eukprot:XP_001323549.1 hypothetical protein [Trichomonas vaginalis G3]
MQNEKSFQASIVGTIIFSCIVAFFAMLISLSYQRPAEDVDPQSVFYPKRFIIDQSFDVPSKKMSEYPNYIYSLTSFFESYFRKMGISYNKLTNDDYVSFEEYRIIEAIILLCLNTSADYSELCEDFSAGRSLSATRIINMLYNEQSQLRKFLKQQNSTKTFLVEFKKPTIGSSVQQIKDMLVSSKNPLILSLPIIEAKYFLPCSISDAQNTLECNKSLTTCPPFYSETFCASKSASTFLSNGDFFIPKKPAVPVVSKKYMNFVVEGFNDDDTCRRSIVEFNSQYFPNGGITVRGLQSGYIGRTISDGQGISSEFTDSKCQNLFSPYSWLPLNISSTSINTYTPLKCLQGSVICNSSHTYALTMLGSSLLRDPSVSEDNYGFTYTYFIDLTTGERIMINSVQFWELNKYFEPLYSNVRDELSCGHYMIPYEYIDLANSLSPGSVLAGDFPLKFSKDSYDSLTTTKVNLSASRT